MRARAHTHTHTHALPQFFRSSNTLWSWVLNLKPQFPGLCSDVPGNWAPRASSFPPDDVTDAWNAAEVTLLCDTWQGLQKPPPGPAVCPHCPTGHCALALHRTARSRLLFPLPTPCGTWASHQSPWYLGQLPKPRVNATRTQVNQRRPRWSGNSNHFRVIHEKRGDLSEPR